MNESLITTVATMARRKEFDVHIRLGALKQRAILLCLLRGGIPLARYARECVERCVNEDMKQYPGARLYMRPNSIVYKHNEGVWTSLTRTIGGERCWILDHAGNLPAELGGHSVYLVDLTVDPGNSGCEARSVMVSADDVYGETQKRKLQ